MFIEHDCTFINLRYVKKIEVIHHHNYWSIYFLDKNDEKIYEINCDESDDIYSRIFPKIREVTKSIELEI